MTARLIAAIAGFFGLGAHSLWRANQHINRLIDDEVDAHADHVIALIQEEPK